MKTIQRQKQQILLLLQTLQLAQEQKLQQLLSLQTNKKTQQLF